MEEPSLSRNARILNCNTNIANSDEFWMICSIITEMMKLIALLSSYIVLCLRLLSSGGVRAIAAENIALRQQLITLSRGKKRAPRLTFFDKITLGILTATISMEEIFLNT